MQETGLTPKLGDPSVQEYLAKKAESLRHGLALEVNGQPMVLRAKSPEIISPEGAGGLPTINPGVVYGVKVHEAAVKTYQLNYRDNNFPARAGWKEIIAMAADGAKLIRSLVPKNAFTELVATKQLSWERFLLAFVIAAALGAFHALEPSHGKTLVATYLVGSRGTMKHALLLGLIVTAAHTAGVYLLGAVTLYASKYVVPEQLYPWLALSSGLMILALGCVLFLRRCRGEDSQHHHGHSHSHDRHTHHHHSHPHDHSHEHGHHHHHRDVGKEVSLKQLLALGISGGIVPCPAALMVLLSAVSLHRVGFGLLLIVAFSVGLAAVLIGIGMLMVYAQTFAARFKGTGPLTTRWLPLTSSVFIVLFGVALTWQALRSSGFKVF